MSSNASLSKITGYQLENAVLPNGLTVLYCTTPETVSFEINMCVNTGSRDEDAETNGVSHFLEHMMFRGCSTYPNSVLLAKNMEQFGGESNAMTTIEQTTYWLKGHSEALQQAVTVFRDFFLFPNFADIEVERRVIEQEVFSDYNDAGTCVDTESLGMGTLFPKDGLGFPIIGRLETIQKMSVENLKQKHERYYQPRNCVLTIYAPCPWAEVFKWVQRAFFGENLPHLWKTMLPEKSHLPAENFLGGGPLWRVNAVLPEKMHAHRPRFSLSLQDNIDNQYHLKIIFPMGGGMDAHATVATFVQRLLDDGICTRLCAALREAAGLVYEVSCDTQFFQEVGSFSIDAIVSVDLFEKLMDALKKELISIFQNGFHQDEIDHIRYRYLFDLQLMKENPTRLLSRAVTGHFFDSSFSLDDEIQFVKSIQKQDLHDFVQGLLGVSVVGFVLVGPKARKKRGVVEKFFSSIW